MNKTLGISLIAALALVSFVPAPAAAAWTCVPDTTLCVCTPVVPCYLECSPITECVPVDCSPITECVPIDCSPLSECVPIDCSPLSECVPFYCSPATQCYSANVQNNGDGTYTVMATYCLGENDWDCSTVSHTVNADHCDYAPTACTVDDLCFTYNPAALTNMCVTTGSDPTTVSHPTVSTTSRTTCVIGNEVCATHAWATIGAGSTTVNVPTVEGYVEATVLCVSTLPCRVTLP